MSLQDKADQIRQQIIEACSSRGGHLGSNLGVVELTVALHEVFDVTKDTLVWDTGHQGYAHKILTGRSLETLNTEDGISRFLSKKEHPTDTYEASHGGTALSTALGIALAKKLKGDTSWTIAIVGDGSMSEGSTWEALNHIPVEKDIRLLVVINVNGFAISPGFGAVHERLQKRDTSLFDNLGYNTNSADGHGVEELVQDLKWVRGLGAYAQVLIVDTVKGYGHPSAEIHPTRMHYVQPFDHKQTSPLSYPDLVSRTLLQEMESDPNIVVITPSTRYATGLDPVFEQFPDRCFDPGMAEQHAMTLACGFALQGLKPVLFYQSTFMQRAFDQLIHDVCYQNLPILILITRSGLAGYDSPTHHGIFDNYLRAIPNLEFVYPAPNLVERIVQSKIRNLTGPVVIAMPYGPVESVVPNIVHGNRTLVICVGNKYRECVQAGAVLGDCTVITEPESLHRVSNFSEIVTVEEYITDGGLGSRVACYITDSGVPRKLLRLGFPKEFVRAGDSENIRKEYGLDTDGIIRQIREWRDR